jgi:hypothetical protein
LHLKSAINGGLVLWLPCLLGSPYNEPMRIGWHQGPDVKGFRPIVWGLFYLTMIPIFAGFYSFTAGGFYQTSALHEPSSLDSAFYVEEDVSTGADRAVGLTCGSCPAAIDGLDITASTVDILVTLGFPAQSGSGDISAQIDIPEHSLPEESDQREGLIQVPYSLLSAPNDDYSSPALQAFEQYSDSRSNPTLPLKMVDMNDLNRLSGAAQGSVSGLPDQFWRMAYFSAVVQTTLGFGDIAPVETFTRILVGTQAVLGVVVVGLFLNALARRRPTL